MQVVEVEGHILAVVVALVVQEVEEMVLYLVAQLHQGLQIWAQAVAALVVVLLVLVGQAL